MVGDRPPDAALQRQVGGAQPAAGRAAGQALARRGHRPLQGQILAGTKRTALHAGFEAEIGLGGGKVSVLNRVIF